MKIPRIILHSHKQESIRRFHPWVFSGAVKIKDDGLQEGDIVVLLDEAGQFLALAHYGTGSIAARIFSFEKTGSIQQVATQRMQQAFQKRAALGFVQNKNTNCYRLFNAEGDGWPGLIVDIYNNLAVIQCHHKGVHMLAEVFAETLRSLYGKRLQHILLAVAHEDTPQQLAGSESSAEVLENGHRFFVDAAIGQKTGFFLDQRDNRQLFGQFAKGRHVLNTFCYSGGFSVYAQAADATRIDSVDSSQKAIDWTQRNIQLNGSGTTHTAYCEDVFDFFKQKRSRYDCIVLDPPAFAKSLAARHRAIQAYRRLNETAIAEIQKGGFIFTFSCSQAVTSDLFEGAVTAAAIGAHRNVCILHRLSQPADHPVSVFHPEGNYLKGLVLMVD